MAKKRLGDILRDRSGISDKEIEKAVLEAGGGSKLLGELLLDRGLITRAELTGALQEVTQVLYLDAGMTPVDPAALKLVPATVARRCCALPVIVQGRKLVVILACPQDLHLLDELRFVTGLEILPRLGLPNEIMEALDRHYGFAEGAVTNLDPARLAVLPPLVVRAALPPSAIAGEAGLELPDQPLEMEFVSTSTHERNRLALREFQAEMRNERTPAVRLVSQIIALAATKKASDIHIEPQAADTAVRIRVDGVLREILRIPQELQTAVVSRIKILADMDISERRVPQDGGFLVKLPGVSLDLRVSTLPTHYGEKVVCRLLDSTSSGVALADLGMPLEASRTLTALLALPQGLLLVTGPTGSGKSSTIYSCLTMVRRPGVNVVTVEDPIEYKIPGINQVQVNVKAGMTFSSSLRALLRQDPNVIMVGKSAIRKPRSSPCRQPKPGNWCFLLCTPMTAWRRSNGWRIWVFHAS